MQGAVYLASVTCMSLTLIIAASWKILGHIGLRLAAGMRDVSETIGDVEWALGLLSERFTAVVWVPGNHDLRTLPDDPHGLRGEQRYLHWWRCAAVWGILAEDAYRVWDGAGGR